MPTITSVGAVKPGGYNGMGDFLANLLDAGVLGYNQKQKEEMDKNKNNDELIKAGISSKTMRPAKEDEKSDFTDSQGRNWVYDDSNLKMEHEQSTKLRQGQMWQQLVDQSYTAAQRNGLQFGTPEYNGFVKQYMAQALGAPNGKFDDATQQRIEDTYGNQAISYMQGLDIGKGAPNLNPKGITYTPQMFMRNAGMLQSIMNNQSPTTPQQPTGPVPVGQGMQDVGSLLSAFNSGGTGNNLYSGMPQNTFVGNQPMQVPANPMNPNASALAALMAMHQGQQGQ